jgi:hypothetical protein
LKLRCIALHVAALFPRGTVGAFSVERFPALSQKKVITVDSDPEGSDAPIIHIAGFERLASKLKRLSLYPTAFHCAL